ncbi:MAG: hypothetical protein ABIQ30_17695 [Devosia sp.]
MGDKPVPNIEIGLSAKAEFKAEIHAEVPKESMGRLVDAITDAFSPFVARQRLKASELRLQQEEVLIKLARKTNERLRVEQRAPNPVPPKFLVPLLEKASLEDPDDDDMIERWAALLAAESGEPGPNRYWCIDMLSSLNSWQAGILDNMFQETATRNFFRVENFTRSTAEVEFRTTVDRASGQSDERIGDIVSAMPGYTLFFRGADIPNTNEFELKDVPEGGDLLHLDVLGLAWLNVGSFVGRDERNFLVNARLSPLGSQFVQLFQVTD